jgi:hypothetical protein
LDLVLKLFEGAKGFALVFYQRVALAHGTQADALAQLVQRGQVAYPAVIDGAQ